MDSLTDDYISARMVHGVRPVKVELTDYDPQWADTYAVWADRIQHAIGHELVDIQHIGSTAVPGLSAKPVVDILAVIYNPDDESTYVDLLERIGFDVVAREPHHRCLRASLSNTAINLHCYPAGHPSISRYILFRDRLRTSQSDRELYAATKRELAGVEWRDINYYAEAKGPVIDAILARAGWETSD